MKMVVFIISDVVWNAWLGSGWKEFCC